MIRFSKYIIVYILLSAAVIIPGIYSIVRYQFKPGIDFTGGTRIEYFGAVTLPEEKISDSAKQNNVELVETSVGSKNTMIRLKTTDEILIAQFIDSLKKEIGESFIVEKNETVGPTLGKELMGKAFAAAILAILAILSYVAYAFKNIKFGVSAVFALFHDVLIMLGSFSLLGHFFGVEVDTLFITAFLTTMSFSVHDTIVIFDRIREYRRRDNRIPLAELCDVALTETMGRSLVNSFTIIFMLLALVLMGGDTVRWFAVALLIGTVTGTYSSPFVATPILIFWDRWEKRKK